MWPSWAAHAWWECDRLFLWELASSWVYGTSLIISLHSEGGGRSVDNDQGKEDQELEKFIPEQGMK